MTTKNEIEEYHNTRSILDCKFIVSIFDKQDREILKMLQTKYPNHIIHMPNSDLIAEGYISGIGGSVPLNWTGLIYSI
jgi:hypothetical protein